MTHADKLAIRVRETDQRIVYQLEQLKRLRALGAAGIDHAIEGLQRLSDIREAYVKILAGPCPLTNPPSRHRPDPRDA
ncbi:MAG TPA: hypothetical protein VGF42_03190 [Caulobacteraceae bacterium]|jgi:hypothetical protein